MRTRYIKTRQHEQWQNNHNCRLFENPFTIPGLDDTGVLEGVPADDAGDDTGEDSGEPPGLVETPCMHAHLNHQHNICIQTQTTCNTTLRCVFAYA